MATVSGQGRSTTPSSSAVHAAGVKKRRVSGSTAQALLTAMPSRH